MRLGQAALHARRLRWSAPRRLNSFHDTSAVPIRHFADVRHPVDQVTDTRLNRPLESTTPATRESPLPDPVTSSPQTEREERIAKAQIVFGSRLAGPAERKAELDRDSTSIAGVLVPPKPEEPDNCCMSGCVNCVWDRYREEFEEWTAKTQEAQAALAAQKKTSLREDGVSVGGGMPGGRVAAHTLHSVDDDGGGSDTNWSTAASGAPDPFADVPVGIREFMKTEKRLKAKHAQETAHG